MCCTLTNFNLSGDKDDFRASNPNRRLGIISSQNPVIRHRDRTEEAYDAECPQRRAGLRLAQTIGTPFRSNNAPCRENTLPGQRIHGI